jgi:hypothetical protein
MDRVALCGLLSFAVGFLSGFQGIYERFPKDYARSTFTIWGLFYLVTRGGIGAAVYFGAGPSLSGVIPNPLTLALVCGAGAEAVLRSQFYIKRVGKGKKAKEDVRWGAAQSPAVLPGLFPNRHR